MNRQLCGRSHNQKRHDGLRLEGVQKPGPAVDFPRDHDFTQLVRVDCGSTPILFFAAAIQTLGIVPDDFESPGVVCGHERLSDGAIISLHRSGVVAGRLARAGSAVRRRDGRALMDVANDLTRRVAEMLRPYSPRVPVEVMLLGFYAREEIASAENDLPRLQLARISIISTWPSLRATVTARGGVATAMRFDSIAKDLTRATTGPDFGTSATSILDEVEAMKRVFTR